MKSSFHVIAALAVSCGPIVAADVRPNVVLILADDNGGNMYDEVAGTTPTSNRPLRGGKATMFEGGTRVPCVIVMPGITRAGSHSDAMIQSEDYYPTLLEALALEPATGQRFDGMSIMPALKGEPFDRGPVFQYFPHDPPVLITRFLSDTKAVVPIPNPVFDPAKDHPELD